MFLFFAALDCVDDVFEKERISQLYYDYSSFVKKIVLHNFRDLKNDVEDIVNTVFISVIKYRKEFLEADDKTVKRLFIIYTNSICINLYNKQKRHMNLFSNYDDITKFEQIEDDFELQNSVAISIDTKRVIKIISQMDIVAQTIIEYKFFYNKTNVEIAKNLGLTPTNVGTILQRSLKRIRREMEISLSE